MRVVRLLLVRWCGVGLQLLVSVILGRTVGAAGTGIYLLFMSWSRLIGRLVNVGLPKYALRSTAVLSARGEPQRAIRFVGRGLLLMGAIGGVLTLVALLGDRALAGLLFRETAQPGLLPIAMLAGTLYGMGLVIGSALTGQDRVDWGLSVQFNIVPALVLAIVAAAYLLGRVTVEVFLWGNVAALLAAALVGWWVFRAGRGAGSARVLKKQPTFATEPDRFDPISLGRLWVNGLLTAALATLPMILLPQFASAADVGRYGVAMRIVAVATTVLTALTSYYAPQFARHYSHGDFDRLARAFHRSQLYAVALYAPVLVASVLFPRAILGLFGDEFRDGVSLLLVLVVGQLFNAVTGIVGIFLSMIHQEKLNVAINAASVAALVVGVVVLGRSFGALGVAAASALVLSVNNLVMYAYARGFLRRLAAGETLVESA